jgi:hypothetical protein
MTLWRFVSESWRRRKSLAIRTSPMRLVRQKRMHLVEVSPRLIVRGELTFFPAHGDSGDESDDVSEATHVSLDGDVESVVGEGAPARTEQLHRFLCVFQGLFLTKRILSIRLRPASRRRYRKILKTQRTKSNFSVAFLSIICIFVCSTSVRSSAMKNLQALLSRQILPESLLKWRVQNRHGVRHRSTRTLILLEFFQ